jgi:hypothetical protein
MEGALKKQPVVVVLLLVSHSASLFPARACGT